MKKWLILAGALAAVLAAILLLRAASVQFLWDYDYAVDPACTATRTVNCVAGFELREGATVLQSISNPTGANNALIRDITLTLQVGPPYGSRTFSLYARGLDGAGAAVYSDPTTVSVTIRPGKPQNVRIQ